MKASSTAALALEQSLRQPPRRHSAPITPADVREWFRAQLAGDDAAFRSALALSDELLTLALQEREDRSAAEVGHFGPHKPLSWQTCDSHAAKVRSERPIGLNELARECARVTGLSYSAVRKHFQRQGLPPGAEDKRG